MRISTTADTQIFRSPLWEALMSLPAKHLAVLAGVGSHRTAEHWRAGRATGSWDALLNMMAGEPAIRAAALAEVERRAGELHARRVAAGR
jgi:hypothetical protein